MYNNYIFDLYGTLIEIKTEEENYGIWEKLALYYGYNGAHYEPDELKSRYYKISEKLLTNNSKIKHPEINIEDVFYKLFKDKDIKPKKKLTKYAVIFFRTLSTKNIKLYDGAYDLLNELNEKNKNIYILANGQSAFVSLELKLLGISDLFKGVYISSDYGIRKPNIKLFDEMTEMENIKKKKTIVIGNDYEDDIYFANNIGIDSLYIKSNMSDTKKSKIDSKYEILDGDVTKIKDLILA